MIKQNKTEVKEKAIMDLLRGGKVSIVADKYGFKKEELHKWKKKALEGIRQSLLAKEGNCREGQTAFQEQLTDINKIETVENPGECPKCGCNRHYQCGTYEMSKYWAIEILSLLNSIKIPRYLCSNCHNLLHLAPKRLFHYLAEGEKRERP